MQLLEEYKKTLNLPCFKFKIRIGRKYFTIFFPFHLDMFRMLQTLEREPQEDMAPMYDVSPAPGRMPGMVIELYPRVLIS